MATPKSVWGIDIGQCALKALKLNEVDEVLQVEGLDIFEHEHILSEPDVDRNQLVRTALETFLSRNSVADCIIAVAVSGQSGLTRFVKLPPVEPKKIPDLVRFEAEQQIPFPINDVIWRWQAFYDPNSPDVEVGIFAMKRVDVAEMLSHFEEVQLNVDVVQMAPLALFNFMQFDNQMAPDGATLLADVGADKTDLVVGDGPRIWTRTIQIGGNDFTEALVKAFKLSFHKAEKLKRSAATSKYARQIFQAMRPVFADLAQEIQRSVGYYTSMRREARFKRFVGLGNGFRLPGLQKFLEQQLNIPVVRIDSYNRLQTGSGGAVNAPMLDENVLSFAVAYGLALQGLELSAVASNLLPEEISRKRLWGRKRPWFAASAAVLLAALAGPVYRGYADRISLAGGEAFAQAQRIASELSDNKSKYDTAIQGPGESQATLDKYTNLFGYRDYWPSVHAVISKTIEGVASDQKLINEYAAADDAGKPRIIAQIKTQDRKIRKMIFIEDITAQFVPDVTAIRAKSVLGEGMAAFSALAVTAAPGAAAPAAGAPKPGYAVRINARTTCDQRSANTMLTALRKESEKVAKDFPVVGVRDYEFRFLPAAGPGGVAPMVRMNEEGGRAMPVTGPQLIAPDPFLPGEESINDTRFVIVWVVSVEGDGLTHSTVGAEGAPPAP